MLVLVEDKAAKRDAQRQLEASVTAQLERLGTKNIGFPSGNVDGTLYSNGDGQLWAAFSNAADAKVPRRWNAFGVYEGKRQAQVITVEINIPTTSNAASVAGFFAYDAAAGATYLMHDGSVGGGKKGVGRSAFMTWSSLDLEEVARNDGEDRAGIIIGRVDDPDLAGRIWRFVKIVRDFKAAVKRGDLENDAAKRSIAEWDEFRSESSGRRKGRRRAEFDYVSYHGDVVEALRVECEANAGKDERVLNSPLIDLMVKANGAMTQIYEVKTGCDRQSLYTAIGQLVTHSADANDDIIRKLVIPEGQLPAGIAPCLAKLGIEVRRYRLTPAPNRVVQLL